MHYQHSHTTILKKALPLHYNHIFNAFTLWRLSSSTWLFLLLILTANLLSGFIAPKANALDTDSTIQVKAASEIEIKRGYLEHIISQQERLVTSLVESPFMSSYVAGYNESDRESLNELFLTTATINKYYMQVRFIDNHGQEKIRIEQSTKGLAPIIIKESALQNKSKREYFIEMTNTLAGDLWHSPFDLNRELGQIEQVPNPTYRISSPVYLNDKFAGMVIINLDMTSVISYLTESTDFLVYLVDADNEVLVHPDATKSWSKYLKGRNKYQETAEQKLKNKTQSLEDIFKNREGIRIILEPIEASSPLPKAK